MARRTRKDAPDPGRTVRMSVTLPAKDHARLAWLAASEGEDRSVVACRMIVAGLKGVSCRVDREDSPGQEGPGTAGL